jgi:flagellar biosynthesis chaperone FliJ
MQEKTTTMKYSLPENSSTDYQSTLSYYKQKVDELYKERLAWLSKFDECNSKLTEKHHLKEKLKKLKED